MIQGRDDEEVEEAIHDVRYALTRAFKAKPQETDAVIAGYLNGATPEGANDSALVGPSQVVRASAAEALGGMTPQIRADLPGLVFEAFSALLTDSYVIVHCAAVKALERFELPENFDRIARDALRSGSRGAERKPMKRREFVTLLGGAAVAWPLSARAQQTAMPVVAFLNQGAAKSDANFAAGFRKGLDEIGYVEGRHAVGRARWQGTG